MSGIRVEGNVSGNVAEVTSAHALQTDSSATTQPVSISGTVPISASALPLPTGASSAALQPALNADGGALAHVTNLPTTQAISAASLPLPSGAATAALQPVINADGGAQSHVTNFPASQPVSAASLPLPAGAATAALQMSIATILGNPAQAGGNVAVSNFPATQPVSIAAAVTVAQATAASLNATVVGTVTANQGATPYADNITQVGGAAIATGTGAGGAGIPRVTVSNDSTVNGPVLTKGTQGTTGFSAQDLKDSGRNLTTFYTLAQVPLTAAEALLSLSGFKSGAAVAATTSPAVVTAGKIFRIQGITLTYISSAATLAFAQVNIRLNTAGAATLTSPILESYIVGQPGTGTATATFAAAIQLDFPDGLELLAGWGFAISALGLITTGVATAAGAIKVTMRGYEY